MLQGCIEVTFLLASDVITNDNKNMGCIEVPPSLFNLVPIKLTENLGSRMSSSATRRTRTHRLCVHVPNQPILPGGGYLILTLCLFWSSCLPLLHIQWACFSLMWLCGHPPPPRRPCQIPSDPLPSPCSWAFRMYLIFASPPAEVIVLY